MSAYAAGGMESVSSEYAPPPELHGEKIGEGHNSNVYRTKDGNLVLKCPKQVPSSTDDPYIRAIDFDMEVYSVLAGCPFIALASAVVVDDRFVPVRPAVPLITMPLAKLGSLKDVIHRNLLTVSIEEENPSYVLIRILDVGLQLAHGLHFAHFSGEVPVIHADLTLENVLVMGTRVVQGLPFELMDVGLRNFKICGTFSKMSGEDGEDTRADRGTSYYRSPEQEEGLELTSKTDVWSLAVIITELLDNSIEMLDSNEYRDVSGALSQFKARNAGERMDMRQFIEALATLLKRACTECGVSDSDLTRTNYYKEGKFELSGASANIYYQRAEFYRRVKQDNDRAEEMFEEVRKLDPTHADAMCEYGYLLESIRQDYDRAEEVYEAILEANPTHVPTLNNYGHMVQIIWEDYEQAEELYKTALQAAPRHIGSLANYASLLKTVRKDYDQAEEMYKAVLAEDRGHIDTLNSYGHLLHIIRKDYDRAEEMYQAALKVDGKHVGALNNYGYFLHTIRREYDRAEDMYKAALEVDPKHIGALGNYGLLLENVREDADGAEGMYKAALEEDPMDVDSLANYGHLLKTTFKNYEQAEEMFKAALRIDPKHGGALSYYAQLLHNAKQEYDRAEEMFRFSLENNPGHVNTLSHYGSFLHTVRKDYNRAETMYKKALDHDPMDVSSLNNYGLLHHAVYEDYSLAEDYYKRALAANPRHVDAMNNYACLLLKDRDPARIMMAKELTNKILAVVPTYENAMSLLSHITEYERENPAKIKLHQKMMKRASQMDASRVVTKEDETAAEQAMRELLLDEEMDSGRGTKSEVKKKSGGGSGGKKKKK